MPPPASAVDGAGWAVQYSFPNFPLRKGRKAHPRAHRGHDRGVAVRARVLAVSRVVARGRGRERRHARHALAGAALHAGAEAAVAQTIRHALERAQRRASSSTHRKRAGRRTQGQKE